MKRSQLIALIAGGVCVIAALAVILGMMLLRGGVFSQAGRAFLEGTTVNGTDVSGLDAQSAAAALAEQTETYSFTLKLGEDSYTATGAELGMRYNQDTDLQSLLDTQKEDRSQLAFDLEKMYTFDLTGFLDQVEQDYNDQLAQAQAQAEAQTLAAQDTAQQEGTPAEGQEGEDAPAEGDSAEAGDAADGESAPAEPPVDPNAPPKRLLTV